MSPPESPPESAPEPPRQGQVRLDPLHAPTCIAGILAERGALSLRLREGKGPFRPLAPRATDLPGLLRAALESTGRAMLEADSPGAILELSADGRLSWVTSDRELADALSSLAAPGEGARRP